MAWLHSAVVWLRNMLYRIGLLPSTTVRIKTIAIGNLSLGGTGKTPHTDYLIDLLGAEKVAVLSRGYGRITKGYLEVGPGLGPEQVGDEPLLLARRHPGALVAVDEDRVRGLRTIEERHPGREVALLDDAMQHRRLRAGRYLLLTTWQRPFTNDTSLPAGSLRDHKVRARDAHAVIVTKTPPQTSADDRTAMAARLAYLGVPVFFSEIGYGQVVPAHDPSLPPVAQFPKIVLVSAIADASLFEAEARKKFEVVKHFAFRDHHAFTAADLQRIRNFIGSFAPGQAAVLTTEKDAMRLHPKDFDVNAQTTPVYYWKINISLGSGTEEFQKLIASYVRS